MPLATKPDAVECSPVLNYGSEIVSTTPYSLPANRSSQGFQNTAVGKYIYVVCDSAGAGNPPYKVVRFDTETNTGTIINTNFSECVNCSFFGTIGNKLWVLGGTREISAQASVSSARTFAVNTPLQSNNLFLQADFGFDNPFPLIDDGKTKNNCLFAQCVHWR